MFPHSHFSATVCPGAIYGSQKEAYIKRVQYWYDVMTGATTATPAAPSSTATSSKLYRVQVGAFKNKANAEKLAAELKGKGYSVIIKEE